MSDSKSALGVLACIMVLCLACAPPADGGLDADLGADLYDPAADPAADLAAAIAEAGASGRRILLEVGGNWCIWCHRLEAFVEGHERVHAVWTDGFVTVKVNYSPEVENRGFLSQYPEVPGYPHLFVLDSDGTFLHSQGTGVLEDGEGYSEEAILAFLEQWAPGRTRTQRPWPPRASTS